MDRMKDTPKVWKDCKASDIIREILTDNSATVKTEATADDYHDPTTYGCMPDALKTAVQQWIKLTIQPAKRVYDKRNSYGLKHDFERSAPGISCAYMTNGQFKGAMLAAGYEPVDRSEDEWHFKIQPRSPLRPYSKKHIEGFGRNFDRFCICHCSQEVRDAYCALIAALKVSKP